MDFSIATIIIKTKSSSFIIINNLQTFLFFKRNSFKEKEQE